MTTTNYAKLTAKKPHGGFRFLIVQQLCLVWWAYRSRLIQLVDLRVWFAAHEMVARRCQLHPDQVPDYTPTELHGLVGGVGGEHLRASLRRLEAIGLLTWSRTQLAFATTPSDLRDVQDLADFQTMQDAIPNPVRRVPVPRQAIRLIAGGCRATVIATMLGHMLRCLYYKDHRCLSGGWCKASWIAEVFRMDLRNIKAARKHLVAIGWLQTHDIPQALCNRWGNYALISLSWTRAAMDKAAKDEADISRSQSPPPPDFSTTRLPPLLKEDIEPFQDHNHQKPVRQTAIVRPLVRSSPSDGPASSGVDRPGQDTLRTPSAASPTLQHIVPEDLHHTDRLLALFQQAQRQGLIGTSDSDRLTFVSLAEHARVVGAENPCGLFAALLHGKRWHFVTESDEDAAHARLKHYLYGAPTRAMPPPTSSPPVLSKDAVIVRYVQTELARVGWQGDGFALVSGDDATWTRARWDRAVAECAHAQASSQHANALHRLGERTGGGDALGHRGAAVAHGDCLV